MSCTNFMQVVFHLLAFFFYISEIVTYTVRGTSGNFAESFLVEGHETFTIAALVQLGVNSLLFVFYVALLMSKCGKEYELRPSVTLFLFMVLFVGILVVNFVSALTESYNIFVQMAINFTGYAAQVMYWTMYWTHPNGDGVDIGLLQNNYSIYGGDRNGNRHGMNANEPEPSPLVELPFLRNMYQVNFVLLIGFILDILIMNLFNEIGTATFELLYLASIIENVMIFEILHLALDYLIEFRLMPFGRWSRKPE